MMGAVVNHLVADSLADGPSAQDPCPVRLPANPRPRPGELNSPCAYLRQWVPSCQASRGWEQDPAVCITPLRVYNCNRAADGPGRCYSLSFAEKTTACLYHAVA